MFTNTLAIANVLHVVSWQVGVVRDVRTYLCYGRVSVVHWGLLDSHARYDSVALPRLEPDVNVQLLLAAEVALHTGHVFLKNITRERSQQ